MQPVSEYRLDSEQASTNSILHKPASSGYEDKSLVQQCRKPRCSPLLETEINDKGNDASATISRLKTDKHIVNQRYSR